MTLNNSIQDMEMSDQISNKVSRRRARSFDALERVTFENIDSNANTPTTDSSSTSGREDNHLVAQCSKKDIFLYKCRLISVLYGSIIIVLGVVLPVVETSMKGVLIRSRLADNIFEIILYSVSTLWLIYSLIEIGFFRKVNFFSNILGVHADKYSHNTEGNSGGLYIKAGCGVFCLISLFYYGLVLAQAFEFENFCGSILIFIKTLIQFIFIFIQYTFLYKHSNVIIHKHLLASHLGITHVIATNICVWFKLILQETFDSGRENEKHQNDPDVYYRMIIPTARSSASSSSLVVEASNEFPRDENKSALPINIEELLEHAYTCKQVSTQVTDILYTMTTYLHPCIIEYSIICVTMLCLMLVNIGKRKNPRRFSEVMQQSQIFHVDCNKTMKGLFTGSLVFLANVILVIMFIVSGASLDTTRSTTTSVSKNGTKVLSKNATTTEIFRTLTLYMTDGFETFLLVVHIVATCIGFWKMRKMEYVPNFKMMSLDEAAELFALSGSLSFSVFRILAFRFAINYTVSTYFLLINGAISFVQSIAQTVFILNGLKKRIGKHEEESKFMLVKKRGREQITFLIMSNISLWLFYTITRNKFTNTLYKDSRIVTNYTHVEDLAPEYLDSRRKKRQALATTTNLLFSDSFDFSYDYKNARAVKWIIINTISYPLLLFYHFHSSCCLSDMWKECYE